MRRVDTLVSTVREAVTELESISTDVEDNALRHGIATVCSKLLVAAANFRFYEALDPDLPPCLKSRWWKLRWDLHRDPHSWDYGVDDCGTRSKRTCVECGVTQSWLAAIKKWQ